MVGVRILTAGEQGLVVEFGNAINVDMNARVHQTANLLRIQMTDELVEVVPTYRSLLVYFNPLRITRLALVKRIEEMLLTMEASTARVEAKVVHIPVCYGGEFGLDLDFVAEHNRLSVDEVVKIHTSTPYLVYMLGFTPGFPYLGGMSERLATPRLEKPRTKIPAGSVGIAGSQTGFYPMESPGGWRLIGRTPIKAFDAVMENPFLFDAGDYLQFVSISSEEYYAIKQDIDDGSYNPVTSILGGGAGSI